jgi:hypothetical protein
VENHEKLQLELSIISTMFQPGSSRVRSRSVKNFATFGRNIDTPMSYGNQRGDRI